MVSLLHLISVKFRRTAKPNLMPGIGKPDITFMYVYFYLKLKSYNRFTFKDIRHNIFFSHDTSSPGIHSKKCVVIEFDKKQYQFEFYVGLEINAPKQYASFFEALCLEAKKTGKLFFNRDNG